jgi:preprotein translocase subunit SecE
VAIVAKPQLRKSAAVAARRPAPTAKTASQRPAWRPRLAAVAAGQLEGRTRGLTAWYRGVVAELRKVTWPTREETIKLSTLVIAISVVVGLFLGTADAIFARLIELLLR